MSLEGSVTTWLGTLQGGNTAEWAGPPRLGLRSVEREVGLIRKIWEQEGSA